MSRVLLVEDSPTDIRFVREALGELNTKVVLEVIENGSEAVEALRDRPSRELPSLVILDLNLPGCRGDAVLAFIRNDPRLATTPVVMMSSSQAPSDIVESYEAHANCYIVKPLEIDSYFEAIKSLEKFWIHTATLPPRERTS